MTIPKKMNERKKRKKHFASQKIYLENVTANVFAVFFVLQRPFIDIMHHLTFTRFVNEVGHSLLLLVR